LSAQSSNSQKIAERATAHQEAPGHTIATPQKLAAAAAPDAKSESKGSRKMAPLMITPPIAQLPSAPPGMKLCKKNGRLVRCLEQHDGQFATGESSPPTDHSKPICKGVGLFKRCTSNAPSEIGSSEVPCRYIGLFKICKPIANPKIDNSTLLVD